MLCELIECKQDETNERKVMRLDNKKPLSRYFKKRALVEVQH